jgi:hypothetical protein
VSAYAWEAIFMLLILKLPVIYLAVVVLWAVRAQPETPGPGGDEVGVLAPLTPCGWNDWKGGRTRRVGWRPIRPATRRTRARLT